MEWRRGDGLRWLLVGLMLLFWWLALNSLVLDSPTMDEQNHIARGITFLRTGDPRLSLEHPPLVNALSGLPLLWLPDLRLPIDQPSWQEMQPPGAYWYFYADQFLWEYNRQQVERIVFLARLPIVWLTLGLALVGMRLARWLWGRRVAWLMVPLLLFDPNVLANGRYSTTDLGATLFVLLAALALWQMWNCPVWSWRRWLAAACCLGLAFASKLSVLAFVPLWALLALLPIYAAAGSGGSGRRMVQFGAAGLVSLLVVWGLFGFEVRPFRFSSDLLAGLNHFSGPMPTFWAGIEQILLLNQGGRTAFLLGETTTTGFWAYFPIALLVKTPVLTLLGTAVALPMLMRQAAYRRQALFLLLPALGYFLLTLQSGLNIGYRHLLPIVPLLYLLIVGAADLLVHASLPANRRLSWVVAGVLMIGQVWTAVTIHPHYLSYFNRLAGGPSQGYNILIDSNIDWGQDLQRLANWLVAQDVEQVKLGWFGTAEPDYYGIHYEALPGLGGVGQPQFFDAWWQLPFDPVRPAPGVYAISVTSLWEFPLATADKHVYAWFRAHEPDARVGYSIVIYDVR